MRKEKTDILYKSFNVCNYFIMILLIIITLYPFYYVFIYSISIPSEAAKGILILPKGLTIKNYIGVFQLNNIASAFIISTLRTVLGTALTIFCCSFFAYLVTQERLFMRKIFYRLTVITLYVNAGIIPWYITMKSYGLKNNFLLYLLPAAMSGYFVILIKTYIEQLPKALEESAKIDGAGYFRIFISIVFPLSKPIIATITVFAAVNQWNGWIDNYFLVSNPKLQTIQLILYKYLQESSQMANMTNDQITKNASTFKLSSESLKVTITMITTIPVILIYPFLQRYFVKGIMLGAVKG